MCIRISNYEPIASMCTIMQHHHRDRKVIKLILQGGHFSVLIKFRDFQMFMTHGNNIQIGLGVFVTVTEQESTCEHFF